MNSKQTIEVQTSKGKLVAEASTDPDYPGIYIDLEVDGVSHSLVLAELPEGEQQLSVKVWGRDQEDYSCNIQVEEKINY